LAYFVCVVVVRAGVVVDEKRRKWWLRRWGLRGGSVHDLDVSLDLEL
jgi:hypothetical protein